MDNYYYLDFEYRPSPNYNDLVCCCILECSRDGKELDRKEFWLNDSEDGKLELIKYINSLVIPTFVAFAAGAEIGCFIDLGLDPLRYRWECLHILGKPAAFTSSSFAKHFLGDWKVVHRTDKELSDKDEKKEERSSVNKKNNLVGFIDYFCGIKREYEEKRDMIDLILSKTEYNEEESRLILDYCWEDVLDLPVLHKGLVDKLYRGDHPRTHGVAETLTNWSFINRNGIPLNRHLLDKAVESAPRIKEDLILEVNEAFEKDGYSPIFERCKDGTYTERYAVICDFIEKSGLSDSWPRSDTGRYKIGRDDTRLFKDNPLVDKWRSTKQLITDLRMITERRVGPRKKADKKEFWDYISEDDSGDYYWQHPYYNPYGSITSRFQPPATSFIYAQPSWMRVLIDPPPGHSILSIDFVSQEIWIAAALSEDLNMMDDYLSGDPYMSFGKGIGYLPKDATKASHTKERNICKGILLGLQFGMGARKLADQIGITVDRSAELVGLHKKRYWKFWEWRRRKISSHEYSGRSHLRGSFWWLADNRCPRTTDKWKEGEHYALTTANFFVQGQGAEMLRNIVEKMRYSSRTTIISTVHDEVNFLCKDENVDVVYDIFKKGVEFICSFVGDFPPCYIDKEVQKHGELLIKPKGRAALERLAPYLGIDV